jgi:hypothetical protein
MPILLQADKGRGDDRVQADESRLAVLVESGCALVAVPVAVSALNVVLWFKLFAFAVRTANNRKPGLFGIEPLVLLSGAYVFGCAFRSILPRADVQRICLFDTWLSSVMIGRSVATVAELSLYFSAAVWASLFLGGFALVKSQLPRYRLRRPLLKAARRPLVIS